MRGRALAVGALFLCTAAHADIDREVARRAFDATGRAGERFVSARFDDDDFVSRPSNYGRNQHVAIQTEWPREWSVMF